MRKSALRLCSAVVLMWATLLVNGEQSFANGEQVQQMDCSWACEPYWADPNCWLFDDLSTAM